MAKLPQFRSFGFGSHSNFGTATCRIGTRQLPELGPALILTPHQKLLKTKKHTENSDKILMTPSRVMFWRVSRARVAQHARNIRLSNISPLRQRLLLTRNRVQKKIELIEA